MKKRINWDQVIQLSDAEMFNENIKDKGFSNPRVAKLLEDMLKNDEDLASDFTEGHFDVDKFFVLTPKGEKELELEHQLTKEDLVVIQNNIAYYYGKKYMDEA